MICNWITVDNKIQYAILQTLQTRLILPELTNSM